MAVEDNPAYAAWRYAQDRLIEAKKRLEGAAESDLSLAQHDLEAAQRDYDAACDEIEP